MKKTTLLTLITVFALALAGCNTVRPVADLSISSDPKPVNVIVNQFRELPKPAQSPIAIAVYSFRDLTGQRKPSTTLSSFSTAVTQGAENYLIKSLLDAGDGEWFKVVERVGLDNLLKERQMIRQTREVYDGKDAKPLPPMTLAGVILESNIVDYNSNVLTGGTGARWLGVGPYTQYTQDTVVIAMRLVSVTSGEVLMAVTIEKNLLSTNEGLTALKFFNTATKAFEFDSAQTFNEPANYALRSAIEQAIVEILRQGETRGLWKFKEQPKISMMPLKDQPKPVVLDSSGMPTNLITNQQ